MAKPVPFGLDEDYINHLREQLFKLDPKLKDTLKSKEDPKPNESGN